MTEYATAETIRAAHWQELEAAENYPFTERDALYWTDAMLNRAPQETDTPPSGESQVIIRVTYASACSLAVPDQTADYTFESGIEHSPDTVVRDARDISLHDDVYGVAMYLADADGTVTMPAPLAIYADGVPVYVDGI